MGLKIATQEDFYPCYQMMKNFSLTTEYGRFFNEEYAQAFVKAQLSNPSGVTILAQDNEVFQGMLSSVATRHPFFPLTIASDLCWWVEPEFRRGRVGLKLLEAFEYWGREKAKADILLLSSFQNSRVGKVYERMGYTKTEDSWTKMTKSHEPVIGDHRCL